MRRFRFGAAGAALWMAAGCGGGDSSRPAPTASATATVTASASATATASAMPSVSATASTTRSATPTVTSTPTATEIPRPPEIVVFGVARADDLAQQHNGVDAEGRLIFNRVQGQGMTLFVEARRGTAALNDLAYDADGAPTGVEFLVSRPLGDGSLAVCDYDPPLIGGVPAVNPPLFSDDPVVIDAIADLGCRVNDGTGDARGRSSSAACTRDQGAVYTFTAAESELQYCLPIAVAWAFPPGDTIVAARVRDVRGLVSAAREIVIRVEGETPFGCDEGLGERVVPVSRPASYLAVSGAPGDVSRDPWMADPLRLCAGPDLGDNVHALTLREDARFAIPLADHTTLCVKILARGSDGLLDCGASTAHDVRATQDAAGAQRITVDSGLGLPAGTGAASLRAPVAVVQLPAGSTTSQCAEAIFDIEFEGVLTTATGTAEIVDANGVPLVSLGRQGENFSCRFWRDGGEGALVLPLPLANTATGDVATVLGLSE